MFGLEHFLSSFLGLGIILVTVIIIIGLILYFLPSFIASGGHKKRSLAIFLLNLFAGWTFVGWLAALIWAAVEEKSNENKPQLKEKTVHLSTKDRAVNNVPDSNITNDINSLDNIPEGTILTGRYKGRISKNQTPEVESPSKTKKSFLDKKLW